MNTLSWQQTRTPVQTSSLALVIPCYNNTVITVELVTFTGLHSLPNPSSAFLAGPRELTELTTFTANEGQTLIITHRNDLSGTIVCSNNPVVLLSGHECGQIHLSATGCGHMMEQMPCTQAHLWDQVLLGAHHCRQCVKGLLSCWNSDKRHEN